MYGRVPAFSKLPEPGQGRHGSRWGSVKERTLISFHLQDTEGQTSPHVLDFHERVLLASYSRQAPNLDVSLPNLCLYTLTFPLTLG